MPTGDELPQPPYFLVFEDEDAPPLTILVDERPAIPLFTSSANAEKFLASTDFGEALRPVETSTVSLIQILETYKGQVGYAALDPPPAGESSMKVRMGGLEELIQALRQSQQSDDLDLFDLGGFDRN